MLGSENSVGLSSRFLRLYAPRRPLCAMQGLIEFRQAVHVADAACRGLNDEAVSRRHDAHCAARWGVGAAVSCPAGDLSRSCGHVLCSCSRPGAFPNVGASAGEGRHARTRVRFDLDEFGLVHVFHVNIRLTRLAGEGRGCWDRRLIYFAGQGVQVGHVAFANREHIP